jgi:hypothetical protein
MNKLLYCFLFTALMGCHQYDEIDGELPNEITVDASQLWIIDALVRDVYIVFEYQGANYQISWDASSYMDANSIPLETVEEDFVFTFPLEDFKSELWENTSDEGAEWGNMFTTFEPFSISFAAIEPLNPGDKSRATLLGIRTLTINFDPDHTQMIYSQFDFVYNSKAYANYYLTNPENMISRTNTILHSMIREYYSSVFIYKL